MIFIETKLKGAFITKLEKLQDIRGFFARTWCRRELANYGLDSELAQCSISFNSKHGTLRGMHYQIAPYAETKLVRCTRGAIYDVIIDLRPDSLTFTHWIATELSAYNWQMIYIPEGFAHGFQTLEDNTEVLYQISEFHAAEYACGIRWNDPVFGICWPPADRIISERDQNYPAYFPDRRP